MNFDFSADEKLVKDQVSRFLTSTCDANVLRSVFEGPAPYASAVWDGLVSMGLTGTAIPEAYGGVGAGYASLCLVAEQLGAHLAPTPFSSSVYLATEAIMLFGTNAQKDLWLPKLATGEVMGTVAVVEGIAQTTEASITVKCADGRLNGKKLIVPDGGTADFAVVLARDVSGDTGLYITELKQGSISQVDVATVDPSRNSTSMDFSDAPAVLLGEVHDGWAQLQQIYDRAAILFAFEQLGGAQSALDMAVNYAKQRFAFGRPIGSFQGLKHMMADMYVALKLAESNCYYAAWALSTNADDLPLAAATARVSATQAFQLCARDNIQVHGGMGFTWEFDCHLYYRRSNYLTLQLGGLSEWEGKLVDSLPKAVA
jgi:alkylation response protein AidB-like acyl-CoA dehydrogenase